MLNRAIATAVAVVLVAPAAFASHVKREVTMPYTQLTGDLITLFCDGSAPTSTGLGGVCMDLEGDELEVGKIAIEDATGLDVGGYWVFTDDVGLDTGQTLASGAFCGQTEDPLEIPEEATALVVLVDGPVNGPLDCLTTNQTPGVAVSGDVVVTFRLGH